MDLDLEAKALLSEYGRDNPITGGRGGPNLASGTVRQMIAAALTLPEERFKKALIFQYESGPSLKPDMIIEIAQAHDIEPDGSRIGVT